MQKNFESINVTANLRRCFERASIISDMFNDEIIRSAYVIISMFNEEESLLNKFFEERGYKILSEVIISSLINYKQNYSDVFGEEAAESFFKNENSKEEINEGKNVEESDSCEDLKGKNETSETEEELLTEKENLKCKIMEALGEMLVYESAELDADMNLDIVYSNNLMEAYEDAATRCLSGRQNFLDIDNLLYSMLNNENSSAYKILKILTEDLRVEILDVVEFLEQNASIYEFSTNSVIIPKSLENCCTILNEKFTKGQKSDILGRDKEIFKLWTIFSKKTKRNAALIGAPGVGKTAIVEALVQDIVNETCPKEFLEYTVIEFDVGSAIAGTKYRGEFEEKINHFKKFLEGTNKVIVFVDEMHEMLGAGSSSEGGGVDLSGALKPILSRDDVIFVGSTTTAEYEKYMSKDLAFKRRFEAITVREPKHHEVYDMIKKRIETLSKYHGVSVNRNLIDYIIVCAGTFNITGHNPDISIDLCDRSMAIAKMRNSKILEKEDIEKVNEEGYKEFNKFPKYKKKSTAIHESAHYVVSMETSRKNMERPIAITIIPTNDCLGFYKYEIDSSFSKGTQQSYLDKIYCLLAGRIAQQLYLNEYWDDGANSDIEKATNIAKAMITKMSLVSYTDTQMPIIFDDDYKYVSDARKEMITKKAEEIVSDAYKKVEEILSRHEVKEKVMKVTDLLLEKKIVTGKELEECLK